VAGNGNQPGRRGLLQRVLFQPVSSVADALVPPIVDAVDLDETLSRVDLDELIQRVDVDAVVRRVDVDAVIRRVDLQALMERIDVNALAERVDFPALIKQVQVGSVVTQGTENLLKSLLDVFRRLAVGIDVLILELFAHLRKRSGPIMTGPPLLVDSRPPDARSVSGFYAGPFSRILAFCIDVFVVVATFGMGASLFRYVVQLLTGHEFAKGGASDPWWFIILAVWFFVYMWAGLALAGRTMGKAVVGLRVLSDDGSPLVQHQSFLRVVLLPFNVILLGLGFFLGVVGARRTALHDRLIGTCVVYDWGDRKAEMPAPVTRWLSTGESSGAMAPEPGDSDKSEAPATISTNGAKPSSPSDADVSITATT
jgi:uncharacterized RDD family membrane protein YckC